MKKKTAIITATAAVTAVAATILVVKKGPKLKDDLLSKVDALKTKIKDIEVSDVKDAIQGKLAELKEEITNFDWDKPKNEVENKFREFKNQINSVRKHLPLATEDEEAVAEVADITDADAKDADEDAKAESIVQ